MLDFGWAELLIIAALGVLVIGPSEIPGLMRGLGNLMRRISYIKYAFTQQFDEFMQEADLDRLRESVNYESKARAEKGEAEFDEAAEDDAESILPEDEQKSSVEDKEGAA